MKKHITCTEDIVDIINLMPMYEVDGVTKGLSEIYRYAKESKCADNVLITMCFQYGYALGKHAERSRKNKGLSIPQI